MPVICTADETLGFYTGLIKAYFGTRDRKMLLQQTYLLTGDEEEKGLIFLCTYTFSDKPEVYISIFGSNGPLQRPEGGYETDLGVLGTKTTLWSFDCYDTTFQSIEAAVCFLKETYKKRNLSWLQEPYLLC